MKWSVVNIFEWIMGFDLGEAKRSTRGAGGSQKWMASVLQIHMN